MKTSLLLLLFLYLPGLHALAEKKQPLDLSIPEEEIIEPYYEQNNETPEKSDALILKSTRGDELTDHCLKLKREYDSMKGKPQRHWALGQRYKMECQAYFNSHKGF